MRYGGSNGWLDGQPCIITHPFGKGRITYIGTILDPNLMTALAQWMVNVSGVTPVFGPVPDGIEVNRRVGPESTVFVLVNFNPEKQIVPLPRPMKSILRQPDPPDEPLVELEPPDEPLVGSAPPDEPLTVRTTGDGC